MAEAAEDDVAQGIASEGVFPQVQMGTVGAPVEVTGWFADVVGARMVRSSVHGLRFRSSAVAECARPVRWRPACSNASLSRLAKLGSSAPEALCLSASAPPPNCCIAAARTASCASSIGRACSAAARASSSAAALALSAA
jgi:hypothetical protein